MVEHQIYCIVLQKLSIAFFVSDFGLHKISDFNSWLLKDFWLLTMFNNNYASWNDNTHSKNFYYICQSVVTSRYK